MADMFNPYEQQIVGLKEQKALAQKLREQAMEPLQGQMVGGWYVAPSWTQALAKGVNAYLGTKREKAAEQGIKDVMAKREQDITGIMGELPQERVIRPENRPEDNVGPVLPAVTKQPTARDYMSWGLRASQIDPSLGQYGNTMANMVQHEQAQQESRDARREDLQMRLEDARLGRQERIDAQRELERMRQEDRASQAELNRQSRADMMRLAASLRPHSPEPLVSVMGPNGPVLTPRSQAVGMTPFNAQTAKNEAANAQKDQAVISSQQVLDQAGKILSHPGLQAGTGFGGATLSKIPGTDAFGFKAELDTFKAQTFVPMVSALKGMGALSDAEGKKLSDSVGALNQGMKREEFEKNLREVTNTLYKKAKAAGLDVQMPENMSAVPSGQRGSVPAAPRRDVVQNPMAAPAPAGGRNVRVDF